ncbi:unnamed protein product [Urochloa humidicola]
MDVVAVTVLSTCCCCILVKEPRGGRSIGSSRLGVIREEIGASAVDGMEASWHACLRTALEQFVVAGSWRVCESETAELLLDIHSCSTGTEDVYS